MSTLLSDVNSFISDSVPYCRRNHVLKSRENIFKPKCNKALKKKLKKYRLRKDGQEDQDIIDVSRNLISSLRINSPNNQSHINTRSVGDFDENKPYNYLTKMVRMKKNKNILESTQTDDTNNKNTKETEPQEVDQEKKQMNAFKLLMESRNKSIGSNSPGKEKCEDETVTQEKFEKRELKAKRLLCLNKMAEAKGSLKKVEIEEYREENVKRKMEDRVKRLKKMIKSVETTKAKKGNIKPSTANLVENSDSPMKQENNRKKGILKDTKPILKTFDIFKDLKMTTPNNLKNISKEDEEFLQKLSPSIKKKENMLCYFQKINKDSETQLDSIEDNSQDSDHLIIKVKVGSKAKLSKSSKLVSKKQKATDIDDREESSSCKSTSNNNNHKIIKRKCDLKCELDNDVLVINNVNDSKEILESGRPKRNSKRPVKYSDDFQLSSSDEELHIFTPKKKRKGKNACEIALQPVHESSLQTNEPEDLNLNTVNMKLKQTIEKECTKKPTAKPSTEKYILIPKKAAKLAPIFVSKPQIDSAALEAKQKFLHSGVPEQLKKNSIQQTNTLVTDEFQKVVHVQNIDDNNIVKIKNFRSFIGNISLDDIHIETKTILFKNLLDLTVLEKPPSPKFHNNIDFALKSIKTSYPKFPVYRTYHLLRGKCKGEFKDCVYPDLDNSVEVINNLVDTVSVNPDKLNWSEKYKPSTEKQVIGNFESIKELRKWLVTWTENNAVSKKSKLNGSDSSDFYQSDTDSRESMKNINNFLIITGKVGSGKTLSVYAVAAELKIKVIEVNASTKRTGKIMLQDLHEATQSHKVDRGKSSADSSQKSQDAKKCSGTLKVMKKRGRKKKITEDSVSTAAKEPSDPIISQENIRTGMSLILIDDADIVFDQDDGFCSAISQLIQASKRPVILVTSSLTCPHLQKFVHLAKIIKMRPFLPRMLGTWLDIMCLVDSNMCSPGFGSKILDMFKGDIRKTINYLQFYMTSHKYLCNNETKELFQDGENMKVNADDENSCQSWAESEGWGDKHTEAAVSEDTISMISGTKQLHSLPSLNLVDNFSVWWNIPNILNYNKKYKYEEENVEINRSHKSNDFKELNIIASTLNTVSITDVIGKSISSEDNNAAASPWFSPESASVIDNENFANYNKNYECLNDIAYELMTKGISEAQRILKFEIKTENNYPGMSVHRERDRVVSRHMNLTSYMNPSSTLDRRALALDYWPACRSICRTEKTKTDYNIKRNNRFCHYLKSLNFLGKNEYFDNLGQSLCFNSDQTNQLKDHICIRILKIQDKPKFSKRNLCNRCYDATNTSMQTHVRFDANLRVNTILPCSKMLHEH